MNTTLCLFYLSRLTSNISDEITHVYRLAVALNKGNLVKLCKKKVYATQDDKCYKCLEIRLLHY